MKLFTTHLLSALATLLISSPYFLQAMEMVAAAKTEQSADKEAESQKATFKIDITDLIVHGYADQVAACAVKKNDTELLTFLVGKVDFARVQLAEHEGNLLQVAAARDCAAAAVFLIDHGVHKDLARKGSPVLTAVQYHSLNVLRVLLAKGARANFSGYNNVSGRSPYTMALNHFLEATRFGPTKQEQDHMVDREMLFALTDNMTLEDLIRYQEDFEKKLIAKGNWHEIDQDVVDESGTHVLFSNPPADNYLSLVKPEIRLLVQKMVGLLPKEKALLVASILHEAVCVLPLLAIPPIDNFFSLLPRELRDIVHSKLRLLRVPTTHQMRYDEAAPPAAADEIPAALPQGDGLDQATIVQIEEATEPESGSRCIVS